MDTQTELIFFFSFFCFLVCILLITLLNLFIKKLSQIDNNVYHDSFITRIK